MLSLRLQFLVENVNLDYRIFFIQLLRTTNTVLANMTVDDCGIGYSF